MNIKKMAQAKNVRRFKLLFVAAVVAITGGTIAFSNAPAALRAASLYSCSDSDRGKMPDILGTLTLRNALTGKTTKITDSCAATNYVMEGFCDTKQKNSYGQVQMKCSNGTCQAGKCVVDAIKPTADLALKKHPSSTPITVLPGASNAVLASYQLEVSVPSVELRTLALGFVTNTPGIFSGSITIKVDGMSIAVTSPATIPNSPSSLLIIPLSTYPTLATGKHTITVEGNISSSARNGSVATTYLDITQVQRSGANQMVYDPSILPTSSDTVTVQIGSLAIENAPGINQTVAVGSARVTLARFSLSPLSAGSGEDVRISSILVTDALTNGATYLDIGNLLLVNESTGQPLTTIASTAVNNSNGVSFTFVSPLTIPKTGSVSLVLKGDILSGSGTHSFTIREPRDVAATGVISNLSLDRTVSTPAAPLITIQSSGGVTLSLVEGSSATPATNRIVYVGQSDVPVFAFKLRASGEPAKIRSLRLTVSGTLGSVLDISNIRIFRETDTSPIASAAQLIPSGTSPDIFYFTWTATDNILPSAIQPGSEITLYVKANIGGAGQAVLGDKFRFTIQNASHVVAVGTNSGATMPIYGAPTANWATSMIAPFNVTVSGEAPVAGSSITQAIVAGSQLGRFKIQNNGSAKISLLNFWILNNGFSQTATNYSLKFSDQNSSNYTANTAVASNPSFYFDIPSSVNLSIEGNSYRFLTASVASLTGGGTSGDNWQLSIPEFGYVLYEATESDLGYDANNDGTLSGKTKPIWVEGRPILGTIVKQ